MKLPRFEARVWDSSKDFYVVVGRFNTRPEAERIATVRALQPGFSHGQVFDREKPECQK